MKVMENEKVSALLSGQREKLGLSADEISRRTFIRRSYIDAIDRGDYKVIPDPVYTKGFIRNYAKAVGLSGDALVRQWVREEGGAAPKTAVSPKKRPLHEIPRTADVAVRATGKRPLNKVEWAIIAAAVLLVVLLWVRFFYL